ncbi:hypothetical protein DFR49_0811 [Hephaestia caeni]|uniref:Uncharacterized protein n=1 Tax=Hephaestia caeni TaxID=645617 RepID=A0A397PG99_9SPHN|nr:hypothetical protein [Hephaestia caeni]RIA46275.1 hypothetical protein DFR49_0811 [Hephaestia caeni]
MPIPERITLYRPRRRLVLNWGAIAYHGLRTIGWTATNLLVVLGLFVCFLALLGNLSFDGLLLQMNNLAVRYLEADAGRRGSFQWLLAGLTTVLFLFVGLLRWHALVPTEPPGDAS